MNDFWFVLALVLAVTLYFNRRKNGEAEEASKAHRESLRQQFEISEQSHQREIKRFLDSFTDPFFSISEEGKIVRCSYAAMEFLKGRELIGRTYQELFIDQGVRLLIQESLKSSQPISKLLTVGVESPFSEGVETSWQIDIRPLAVRDNDLEFQLMMRNMTSFVQAEQIRQDFIANASHELRTPLSIISGYLEILTEQDGLDSPELARKMLTTMERHTDRINRIVDDMLLISRLESGESAPLIIEPFRLKECVSDVIERLDLLIEKQSATVTIDLPEVTLHGDRFYWTQVLFNLIENALKQNTASPVEVSVIAQELEGGKIEISIIDNGIGIPSADLPYIFKRFFRVEKHHGQNEIKGTGLGLSIVKRAIEAHGGTITARSTPGVETVFIIRVPVDESERLIGEHSGTSEE
ncbi:MAG: sensor histidine kinase [Akkermansiaceae bacterium]